MEGVIMLRVFEAFSGIGTQRMALRNLGIEHEVVCIAEIDEFAIRSYEAIHGETLNLGDVSKIDPNDVPGHDLFTYSFPCQDISVAGKGKGFEPESGTRSSLLWECEKIIETKRPKYLLMENVKALIFKKSKPVFEMWLRLMEELGYTNYWQVLNAKDYGIPQSRERVFCVSILGTHEPYVFPKPIPLDKRLKDVLEDGVDERFYINSEKAYELLVKLNHQLPNQETSYCIDANYHKGTTIEQFVTKRRRQLVQENPPNRIRKLTPRECWRLMGISDEDFEKAQEVNSNTQLYTQAGNAIVVDVLEGIFRELFLSKSRVISSIEEG